MKKFKEGYYAVPCSRGYMVMEGDIEAASLFDHVVFSADNIQELEKEADEKGLLEEEEE